MNWTIEHMPSLEGKTAIVTGGTSGLGYETSRFLAMKRARVILGVRSLDRGQQAIDSIQAQQPDAVLGMLPIDLGSLASIRLFASNFQSQYKRLDILINNAGLGGKDAQLTDDGFPRMMGVNHLGHFALTGLLLDVLSITPKSRVVSVTSQVYKNASISLDQLTTPDVNTYGSSKLANLLFALELQRRLSRNQLSTTSLAAHPGASRTEGVNQMLHESTNPLFKLLFGFFVKNVMQSAAMGALNSLRAATDPNATGGELYGPSGVLSIRGYPVAQTPTGKAKRVDLAQDLWERSEESTGIRYLS